MTTERQRTARSNDAVGGDLEKLQGTWRVTSLETDGRTMSPSTFHDSAIVIKGHKFTTASMGAKYKGTVDIHEETTPRSFDLVFSAGAEKGARNLGIYTIDGDRWTICLATRGTIRPKAFTTTPNSGLALETLMRERAPTKVPNKRASSPTLPAATPAKRNGVSEGPASEIDGDWSLVSAVFNGAPFDKKLIGWVKRVTRGGVTTVTAGPNTMLRADFTLNASASPWEIEYVNLEGADKGKAQAGICQLADGALSICVAAPGRPRPTAFSSSNGDGRSLTIWRLSSR
jgi:uncharacterized protein (TIGR03067 family)